MFIGANENTRAPTWGNQEGENSSNVYMMSAHVDVSTRSHDYGESKSYEAKVDPDVLEPLHIKRPAVEPIPRMPKRSTKRTAINFNAKAAQNYSIVEDLAQSPCAMSTLEVLQSCPTPRSVFLIPIGAVDPKSSLMITFDMSYLKKRLPHHMDFQNKSMYQKINIF